MLFFVIIGYLASIVIFHEVWHIIHHGIPDGVCVGWLNATGGDAVSGVIFNPTQPLNMQEEINAWWFGIIIASLLWGLFVFTQWKLKSYE